MSFSHWLACSQWHGCSSSSPPSFKLKEKRRKGAKSSNATPIARRNNNPYSLIRLRTWFPLSRRTVTRRNRATIIARVCGLSTLSTFTSPYRPTRTSSAEALRLVFDQSCSCEPTRLRARAEHRYGQRKRTFMPRPTRDRATFEPDALGMRRMLTKQAGQRSRIRSGRSSIARPRQQREYRPPEHRLQITSSFADLALTDMWNGTGCKIFLWLNKRCRRGHMFGL